MVAAAGVPPEDSTERGSQPLVNPIPFPLIVILLSISVALLIIGAAYTLRKHQEHLSKQIKTVNPTTVKEISRVTPASLHSSSSSGSSYHHHHHHHHPKVKPTCEQQQLLVSTTSTHSSSSSSYDHHHHQHHHHRQAVPLTHLACQKIPEPIIEIPMSRCSCYGGDHSSDTSLPTPPPPPPRTFGDHHATNSGGFNNSFLGSTNQSLHFGHWT